MPYDDEVRETVYYSREERLRALVGAVAIFGLWFLLNWLLGDFSAWRYIGPLIMWFGVLRCLFIAIFGQLSYDLDG